MVERKIGLISNQTGVASTGKPTWKALSEAGYSIQCLFGPEHGFLGDAQDAVHVDNQIFEGMKVYSLFGERTSPTAEMFQDVDTLLFDIQDIGCRYYTYLYTLAYSMRACANEKRAFVVLDRPNPIGGNVIEGGPISEDWASFVGGFGLPHRHGFTVGEYAQYLKDNYFPEADLHVIPMEGYRRAMTLTATSYPWIPPSPNIPTVETAFVYPGTCLFEGTNLSEGRGTTRPFEMIGSPWINAENLRQNLSALTIPGVLFTASYFTPTSSKYRDQFCQGITFHVTNRDVFRSLYASIVVLRFLKETYSDLFRWKPDWEGEGKFFVDKLAGGPRLRTMIDAGKAQSEIYEVVSEGQPEFIQRRSEYLLYE